MYVYYPIIGLCPLEWAFINISEAMHGALVNRQRILCPQNCLPQVEELVESFPTRGPGPSSSNGWVDSHARMRGIPCLRPAKTCEKALPTGVGTQSLRDKRATVRLEGPAPRSVAPWHHWDPNTRRYGAVSRGYIENPRSSWCALPISPAFRFIDCELGCGPLWLPHSGCVRRVSPPFRPRHQCDRYPPRGRPSYFS